MMLVSFATHFLHTRDHPRSPDRMLKITVESEPIEFCNYKFRDLKIYQTMGKATPMFHNPQIELEIPRMGDMLYRLPYRSGYQ